MPAAALGLSLPAQQPFGADEGIRLSLLVLATETARNEYRRWRYFPVIDIKHIRCPGGH